MNKFELTRNQYCSCETTQSLETNSDFISINQETAQKVHEICLSCLNKIQIDPNFLHFINDDIPNIFYKSLLDQSILDDQPFLKKSKNISFSKESSLKSQ